MILGNGTYQEPFNQLVSRGDTNEILVEMRGTCYSETGSALVMGFLFSVGILTRGAIPDPPNFRQILSSSIEKIWD